jgi:flagellar motility protein MotE (MotC chaperone)
MKSVLSVQKEIVNKAGINANIPDAAINAIRDTNDGINKAYSVQNQIVQTAFDAAKQNIKTFNDNAKAFADLNKNITQSWISVFTQRNN